MNFTEHFDTWESLQWVFSKKDFDECLRSCSYIITCWIGFILVTFQRTHITRSHVILTLMGIILKHFEELLITRSHVIITLMGIILEHFKELHITRSHIIINLVGIILEYFEEVHIAYSQVIISKWVFFSNMLISFNNCLNRHWSQSFRRSLLITLKPYNHSDVYCC